MTANPISTPIPVFCDHCRAQGHAGEDDFAHLDDLLDFEPVPRRKTRVDGWTPEVQRFFIIALVATGSDRQAARAVNKAAFGVEQLKRAEGNESFLRAHARALEIHAADNSHRLAEGVRAVTNAAASWRAKPAWSGAATRQQSLPAPAPAPASAEDLTREEDEIAKVALLDMARQLMIKLGQERTARLAGKIAEADFYVRQITWYETAMDVIGEDVVVFLRDFQKNGHDLIDLVATPLAMLLDTVRRDHWDRIGEPERPEHPPRHLIKVHDDGLVTEPMNYIQGAPQQSYDSLKPALDEQQQRDAEAVVAWEAEACRDYERRRAAAPFMDEEPGSAGQPAP
jgi:hypothetical protein